MWILFESGHVASLSVLDYYLIIPTSTCNMAVVAGGAAHIYPYETPDDPGFDGVHIGSV